MDNIKVILLDVGGVLIDFVSVDKILEWIGKDISVDELSDMWRFSKALCMFETGRCDSTEFAKMIISELKLPVLPEEFLNEFALFPKGFYPEAKSLLQELSKDYFLSCFSNISCFHWDVLNSQHNLGKYFKKHFLSFEIGLMKPNKDAYMHVIKELGCEPDQILFFDDSQANVSMGNEVGMRAYRVLETSGLKVKLEALNILK